jgi:RHS repeat-associated protein
MAYDGENRQKSAVSPNNGSTSYEYDGDGKRVLKLNCSGGAACTDASPNLTTTVYVYDALGQLAAEYGGVPLTSGTQYLTTDHLGSTRLVTDTAGSITRRYDYLPFGDQLDQSHNGRSSAYSTVAYPVFPPDGQPLKFTSKERDAETGLDYFGARYMSAAQGRFTSPDGPFNDQDPADPQSWNLYSYVRNNPLINTDPTGQDCVYAGVPDSTGVTVTVETGNCSKKSGGTYVNGTIDTTSFKYDSKTNRLDFGFTNPDAGAGVYSLGLREAPDPGILALQRGTQLAEPGVMLAFEGLKLFGYIVAPPAMALAECGAKGKDCSASSTAMAVLPLPRGALKVLGTLAPLAETTVSNAVRLRGGGGAQVNRIATWLQQMPLGEVAKLAAEGNGEAVTAVKIVKDASRLSQK